MKLFIFTNKPESIFAWVELLRNCSVEMKLH